MLPARVITHYGIIVTIREHIVTLYAAVCADVAISIQEPSYLGIIIPCLQVVESRFGIVVIPAISERVNLSYRACKRAGNA